MSCLQSRVGGDSTRQGSKRSGGVVYTPEPVGPRLSRDPRELLELSTVQGRWSINYPQVQESWWGCLQSRVGAASTIQESKMAGRVVYSPGLVGPQLSKAPIGLVGLHTVHSQWNLNYPGVQEGWWRWLQSRVGGASTFQRSKRVGGAGGLSTYQSCWGLNNPGVQEGW